MSDFDSLVAKVIDEVKNVDCDVSDKTEAVFQGFTDLHNSDGHKLKMIAWDRK
jgi:hypothetical protein